MRATTDNIRHLPEGALLLLRFIAPGAATNGKIAIGRIGAYKEITGQPVAFEDYQKIDTVEKMMELVDPHAWETQLRGDMHEILATYLPESAICHRRPTSADVGLVVVGTELRDTVVQRTVRFRLFEVENGYARVEGGGSFRIEDHDWLIDPNSRVVAPTDALINKYSDAITDTGELGAIDWQTLLAAFGEEYVTAYQQEAEAKARAGYRDDDTDPSDLDDV